MVDQTEEQAPTTPVASDTAKGFTPGPWVVSDKVCALADTRYLVVLAPDRRWVSLVMEDDGICEADARLIAAAPELLAACQEFVRKVDAGEARSNVSYGQMKAAIAKALGQ